MGARELDLFDVVCGRCRRRAAPPGPPVCPTCGCFSSYGPGPAAARVARSRPTPPPARQDRAGRPTGAPLVSLDVQADPEPLEGASEPVRKSDMGAELVDEVLDLADIPVDHVVRLPTGFEPVDRVLGGGFGKGLAILFGGRRGTGKTRLLTQLLGLLVLEHGGIGYYASREEVGGSLTNYADEVAGEARRRRALKFSRPASIESFCATVRKLRPTVAVLDSLQTVAGERLEAQLRAATMVYELAHDLGIPIVAVSQMNAEGQMRGSQAIQQAVDQIVRLDPIEGRDGFCVLRIDGKSRGAAVHHKAILHHEDDGLRAVENDEAS